MQEDQWLPQIDRQLCTGCGDCITRCPTDALGDVDGKAALVNPEVCTYCVACEDVCPVNAIALPFLICKDESCEQEDQIRRGKRAAPTDS